MIFLGMDVIPGDSVQVVGMKMVLEKEQPSSKDGGDRSVVKD